VPEGGSQPIWVRLAEEHGKAKAAQFMSQIGGGNGGGGGGGNGGGGGGGFHHMAHRGRSNRTTRSQKPHPYNHAQKFI